VALLQVNISYPYSLHALFPVTILLPVRLDSDYDKLNIKVRAEMGHGIEVKMVTGNRGCNG
jgi:hypothetical protein